MYMYMWLQLLWRYEKGQLYLKDVYVCIFEQYAYVVTTRVETK